MEVLLLLVSGVINAFCFFIGAKVGQKVVKGENVEMPNLNPITAMKERNEKKQMEIERRIEKDRRDTIMENINSYDGTSRGQREVPRG